MMDTHLAFHLTETGTAYQSRLKIVTMVPKALTAGSHVFFRTTVCQIIFN